MNPSIIRSWVLLNLYSRSEGFCLWASSAICSHNSLGSCHPWAFLWTCHINWALESLRRRHVFLPLIKLVWFLSESPPYFFFPEHQNNHRSYHTIVKHRGYLLHGGPCLAQPKAVLAPSDPELKFFWFFVRMWGSLQNHQSTHLEILACLALPDCALPQLRSKGALPFTSPSVSLLFAISREQLNSDEPRTQLTKLDNSPKTVLSEVKESSW